MVRLLRAVLHVLVCVLVHVDRNVQVLVETNARVVQADVQTHVR